MGSSTKSSDEVRSAPATMSIREHVLELRARLIYALLGIALGAVGGWFLVDPVLAFMQAPLADLPGADAHLNFQTVGAALDLKFTFALWIGVIVSSPWWLLQLGLFIWPGLKHGERINAVAFGATGLLLFAAGAVGGMFVAPKAVSILLSFVPQDAAVLLRVDSYVQFYLTLVVVFGFSMLLPEVLVALNRIHVLPARTMVKAWRWAVVVAFFIAAVTNPLPNPLPMIIQAFALIGLFFLAVGISALLERLDAGRRAAKEAAE